MIDVTTGAATVTATAAGRALVTPPPVALINVPPPARPLTIPLPSILATDGSLELHVKGTPGIVLPPASLAVAVNG